MPSLDQIRGRQVVIYGVNKSGGTLVAGDVVIVDTANDTAFTTTTSANSTKPVGVVQESIANNASGRVAVQGYVALVNVPASQTRGQYLATHTVAKQAAGAAARVAGSFAYLETGGTTPAAYLFGVPDLGSTGTTSPLTTKGDVWGYSSLDARIPVGTNGQVLTADSAQTLGLKWAAAAGGATIVYPGLKPGSFDATYGDDFTTAALNARWNSAHGATLANAFGGAIDGSHCEVPFFNVLEPELFQAAPAGDFDFRVGGMYCATDNASTTLMYGAFILDSAGTGVGAITYSDGNGYLAAITAYQYNSAIATMTGAGWNKYAGAGAQPARLWARLVKASGVYTAYLSWSGKTWDYTAGGTPTAFTVNKMGFGVCLPSGSSGRFGAEWVDKV